MKRIIFSIFLLSCWNVYAGPREFTDNNRRPCVENKYGTTICQGYNVSIKNRGGKFRVTDVDLGPSQEGIAILKNQEGRTVGEERFPNLEIISR